MLNRKYEQHVKCQLSKHCRQYCLRVEAIALKTKPLKGILHFVDGPASRRSSRAF